MAPSAGWRSTFGALVLWSPVVVALTVACAVGAPAAADRLPSGGRTEAVVGLTSESEWPFHDSWMALVAGTLDGGTIVAEAQEQLGIDPSTSRVETEPNNSSARSTLTVTVTAGSDGEAVALANEVVEQMVVAAGAAPVAVLDRADLPTPPPRRSTALAGAFVGLLGGVALVPWLDRRFGPVRSSGHPEFRGRVDRWVEPGRPTALLPIENGEAELAAALRWTPGPLAVVSTHGSELATAVAKVLASEVSAEVIDVGSVGDAGAAEMMTGARSVVVVAPRRSIRRNRLDRVLSRLESLGLSAPVVVLTSDG
jgi:hypothetical protein